MLIKSGADVNTPNELEDTLLTVASYKDHFEVVKEFIQTSANVNI